jgi:hypothetical protein
MEVNMSHRGSFFIRLVGVMLLVGVLFAVGVLAFRLGQAQGYALGLTVSGEELSTSPAGALGLYPGYGYWARPYFGFMPFWPLLCLFGLGVVFLFALGAIFRPRHWHGYRRPGRPGEPQPEDWHAHWHGWHGGPPPWASDKESPTQAPNQAEPPSESSAEAG